MKAKIVDVLMTGDGRIFHYGDFVILKCKKYTNDNTFVLRGKILGMLGDEIRIDASVKFRSDIRTLSIDTIESIEKVEGG